MIGAAAAYCVLSEGPLAEETLVSGHQPAVCELPRKLDGYFFFWAFSAAFVTLPWVSLKVTLCKLTRLHISQQVCNFLWNPTSYYVARFASFQYCESIFEYFEDRQFCEKNKYRFFDIRQKMRDFRDTFETKMSQKTGNFLTVFLY